MIFRYTIFNSKVAADRETVTQPFHLTKKNIFAKIHLLE